MTGQKSLSFFCWALKKKKKEIGGSSNVGGELKYFRGGGTTDTRG